RKVRRRCGRIYAHSRERQHCNFCRRLPPCMTRATVFLLIVNEMHCCLIPSVVANFFVFSVSLSSLRTRVASEARAFAFSLFHARRRPTFRSLVKMQMV